MVVLSVGRRGVGWGRALSDSGWWTADGRKFLLLFRTARPGHRDSRNDFRSFENIIYIKIEILSNKNATKRYSRLFKINLGFSVR